MKKEIINHYDLLIDEGNDPVNDPIELKEYMDKWDGKDFELALNLSGKEDVLEIGVGTGRLALRAIEKSKTFTGIDISSKTIETCKNHLKKYNFELICDDFLTYEFNKKFDVIYSSLTFIHFKEKDEILDKCYDLLNENGRLIVSIDKSQNEVLDYGSRKITIYPITKHGFLNLAYLSGFRIIEIKEVEFAYIFVLRKE